MAKRRIAIIDIVTNAPTRTLYARTVHANLASIMPQAIAAWCEQEGHCVEYLCYTGLEDLKRELPEKVDIAFIGAFTSSALLAYAMSNMLRSRGAVTVLGGPHARAYPVDSQKYFDYVTGLTDKAVILEILRDCSKYRPVGRRIGAKRQPEHLPSVSERWKFIQAALRKALCIKVVPIMGSMGCPYTCSFCIDSIVPYQKMDFDDLKEDLRFLRRQMRRPVIGWHDPNFGVRMNEYMDMLEEAVPPGSIDSLAESSLSLLSEPNLRRLQRNGFKHIAPGIESWYALGDKSKTRAVTGLQKVQQISEHVNTMLRYIPSVDTNIILGLDFDHGDEPFELTKRFFDITPGAYQGLYLLTAFGGSVKSNADYLRAGRIVPFPFHFMNTIRATNVKPKNYTWPVFYDHVIDVFRHTYSWSAVVRRFRTTRTMTRWVNALRGASAEGQARLNFLVEVRRRLECDADMRPFFEGETTNLPRFYIERARRDLGEFWNWLPQGSLQYDPRREFERTWSDDLTPPREGRSKIAIAVNAAS